MIHNIRYGYNTPTTPTTTDYVNFYIAYNGIYVYDDDSHQWQWRHGEHDMFHIFTTTPFAIPPQATVKQYEQTTQREQTITLTQQPETTHYPQSYIAIKDCTYERMVHIDIDILIKYGGI